jgi:ABC-type molybdate transport system substrate-binding protein
VLTCAALLLAGAGAGAQTVTSLTVCHAGSLTAAFSVVERTFEAQHPGVKVTDVSGGSVALATRLATGTQACDVYASADYLNIERLLEPAGIADYTIAFGQGRMVLAYLSTDPLTQGIAAAGAFTPPGTIPKAADDWYRRLLAPGVRVAASHPFVDPGGYRAHLIAQLAQRFYKVPNLANLLLEHYTIVPDVGGVSGGSGRTLGRDFSFQFTYEHSAAATAKGNPAYRYVTLPDRVDLSTDANNAYYAAAAVTMPGIADAEGKSPQVAMPATRVTWGLTIPRRSANREAAAAFVALLLGPQGRAALTANGPPPISPARIGADDYSRLPKSLQPLVKVATTR